MSSLYTLFSCFFLLFLALTAKATHPDPESIVQDLHSKVNESVWKRQQMLDQNPCQTGNPVDDCWRCDPDWQTTNRQRLADCGVGFGQHALGGKGGQMYLVTDPSDNNPQNPTPGTLRYATVQTQPLWIVFSASMIIKLNLGLTVNSFMTIDGRGVDVHITGAGCILILNANNVIIPNLRIHNCVPSLDSDGDGISILGSQNIWVDHCSLSYCADGLVDVTLGSTGVTISNNYFSHHDKVMLLGHNDEYEADRGMQVTVAFNLFGEALTERMPRCRWGYFHVVNNDYRQWGAYAVGGSASPTINSQGNRYIAPSTNYAKEVTARINSDKQEWSRWNWRTEGDIMMNGAFFVPSGYGGLAASVAPKPAALIDQLTMNAGVFGNNNQNPKSRPSPGDDGGGSGDYPGIIYGSEAPIKSSIFLIHLIITCIWIIHIISAQFRR